jgi:hypothetical protein
MRYPFQFLAMAASLLVGLSACGAARTAPAAPAPTEPTAAQVAALREKLGNWVIDQPGVVLPANRAALDEALAKADWSYLVTAAQSANSQDEAEHLLHWERYQLYRGGGYNIAFMYVRDLWRMGQSYEKAAAKGPEYAVQSRGLKTSALSYLLYTYAMIAVDGERCADPTAPQYHRDQITQFTDQIRLFANQLTPEERAKAVTTAITLEKRISPVRDLDPALCHGGIQELGQALEANPRAAKVRPSEPGYPGTNVDVMIDPKSKPALSDRSQWPARQQKVRDLLPNAIGAVVGALPATGQP